MISLQELNQHNYPTTPEIDEALQTLLASINVIRSAYNIPMIVTSGLRSQEQQQALIAAGKSNAPKSHHLVGEAVDIQDTDGALHAWTLANPAIVELAGLWMENRQGGWQHFQTKPFG